MSSLRNQLSGVMQDATFHPEGDAWVHTRAVRQSLDEAIQQLQASALGRRIGFRPSGLTAGDRNLLRLAAWCHDLGKATATTLQNGRWSSRGHETPRFVNPVLRRLGRPWRGMWERGSFTDRKAFVYLVTRHMAICDDCGLPRPVLRDLTRGDAPRTARARLLVVFLLMDRLGCARLSRVEDAELAIRAIEKNLAYPEATGCANPRCRFKASR